MISKYSSIATPCIPPTRLHPSLTVPMAALQLSCKLFTKRFIKPILRNFFKPTKSGARTSVLLFYMDVGWHGVVYSRFQGYMCQDMSCIPCKRSLRTIPFFSIQTWLALCSRLLTNIPSLLPSWSLACGLVLVWGPPLCSLSTVGLVSCYFPTVCLSISNKIFNK